MSRAVLLIFCFFIYNYSNADEVVVFGDSMGCALQTPLMADLAKNGHKIFYYCAPSTRPEHWITGTFPGFPLTCSLSSTEFAGSKNCGHSGDIIKLSEIIAQHPSAIYIPILSTASASTEIGHPDEYYALAGKMIHDSGSQCYWVGAPISYPEGAGTDKARAKRLADRNEVLKTFYPELVEKLKGHCQVIDSRVPTQPGTPGYGTKEGLHPTEEGAAVWAEYIVQEMGV